MKKKVIISESELRDIINRCVKRIMISESGIRNYDSEEYEDKDDEYPELEDDYSESEDEYDEDPEYEPTEEDLVGLDDEIEKTGKEPGRKYVLVKDYDDEDSYNDDFNGYDDVYY